MLENLLTFKLTSRCVLPRDSTILAKGGTDPKTRIRNISIWDPGRKCRLWRCDPVVRGDIGDQWHQADCRSPAPACFSSWELITTSCRKPELESIVQLSFCLKIWPFFPPYCVYVFICWRTSLVGQSSSENNSVRGGQVQVGHRCRKHLWAQCHPLLHGCTAVSPAPACGAAAGPELELPANSSSAGCEVQLLWTNSAVKTWEWCLFAQAELRKVAALRGGCAELLPVGLCSAGPSGCRWEVWMCRKALGFFLFLSTEKIWAIQIICLFPCADNLTAFLKALVSLKYARPKLVLILVWRPGA